MKSRLMSVVITLLVNGADVVLADYEISPNSGPYAGGNTLIITNGNFGTITNVIVGGMAAAIQAYGANWVRITAPGTGSPGVKSIVIQASDAGDIILANSYTVNPAGRLSQPWTDRLPSFITLTNTWLNGTNGIILAGAKAGDASGKAVSSAGDVNGDGRADFLVTATGADPYGQNMAGETYLLYGRSSGFPVAITLTNTWLDGTNGMILAGAVNELFSGNAVSSAGDVNGDGYDDLLIGAEKAKDYSGEVYLIYGRSNGSPVTVALTNTWLDGTNGSMMVGIQHYYYSGCAVSSAGDVNGDGLSDILIGAYSASPLGRSGAGETYLIYGRSNGLPAMITLTNTWLDGTNGCLLTGAGTSDGVGRSVSSAGDVNGDGLSDILVGANSASVAGRRYVGAAYLIYGRSNGLPAMITLTNTWLDGTNGVILAGANTNDYCGRSVGTAGDVNGDGLSDLLVGATGADSLGHINAGEVYLVYGCRNGLPPMITMTNTWLNGTNGCLFAGMSSVNDCGYSVGSAGDVDGNGLPDILIGAPGASSSGYVIAGETYLVYSQSNGFPAMTVMTNTWLNGTNGVIFAGGVAMSYSGRTTSSAGDINGDGLADLLVGAYNANPFGRSGAGETYVIYGRSSAMHYPITPSSGSTTGGYPVIITGTNLGNGTDITNVTLCGANASSIIQQSSTQIVIVAGAAGAGVGDVRIFSVSFGETIQSNVFEYFKENQVITFPSIPTQAITNRYGLSATANSGLNVNFSILSGAATLAEGTNLAFFSTGVVSMIASQPGNSAWNPAPEMTNSFDVLAVYTLTIQPSMHGLTVPGAGTYEFMEGQNATVTATASAYYHFGRWTGDAGGAENPLRLLMNASKTVQTVFVANLTTNTPVPVPEPWLAQYGLTNFGVDAAMDSDGDGQLTWQEYATAESDPTNPFSFFHTEARENGRLIVWPSASGRVYRVQQMGRILDYEWTTISGWTNLPATPPINTVTNPEAAMTNLLQFFRIVGELDDE
jgi:hypothetical protein